MSLDDGRIPRLRAALHAQPDDLDAARDLAREALRHDALAPLTEALACLIQAEGWDDATPLLAHALPDSAPTRARALYDATHDAPSQAHFQLAIRALVALTPAAAPWLQELLRARPLHAWCALVAMRAPSSRHALLERAVPWLEVLVPPSRLYSAFGVLSSRVSDIFSLNRFTRPLLEAELERALSVGTLRDAGGDIHLGHHFALPALPEVTCVRCLDRQRCPACNGRGQSRTSGSGRGGFVLCERCHGRGRCPACEPG